MHTGSTNVRICADVYESIWTPTQFLVDFVENGKFELVHVTHFMVELGEDLAT
jgi:hypothetical protein